jgi:hypothetical protein
MPGRDPRHLDLRPTRGARIDDAGGASLEAPNDRVRQRDRVHLEGHARLGSDRMTFHCAREADAERLL